uniref:Coiled-coil and C2 domain-containing protein 1B n=1 Tax=Anabas testudineus TaxID=64144 RepID=A0A7N6F7C4_ANATE
MGVTKSKIQTHTSANKEDLHGWAYTSTCGFGRGCVWGMGLFVDLSPEEMMMGVEENLDDTDLEAELAAITGNKAAARVQAKTKGKTPLPMEDIAKMADECMKDVDEDDDYDNVEDDEDLLELPFVFGIALVKQQEIKVSSAAPGSLQHTLEERVAMYKAALQNAKTAGDTSKSRRFDRGLKTLETMLAAVKKGKPVNEAEIPPPVATGAPSVAPRPPVPARPAPPVPTCPEPTISDQQMEAKATTPPDAAPEIITPSLSSLPSPGEQTGEPAQQLQSSLTHGQFVGLHTNEATKTILLERQKEYRMAALKAKKQGDVEQAKLYIKTSKMFDAVIEALEKGQPVDLSGLPPSPEQVIQLSFHPSAPAAPAAPKDVLEALEQRRAKYVEASTQAKASGDERKARMHDRIAKQYQSAIRAHKAGKAVDFDELPVPPGFPPLPGQKASTAEQGFVAALETANKLATTDAAEVADEEEDEEEVKECYFVFCRPLAVEQLEFLEGRKKQYMKAALQAKQYKDMEQAKSFLRTAKGLDPMIEAARSGKAVDISTVPSPPGDEDEDFILIHHSEVQNSDKAEQVYTQLANILKEQYEKCLTHSKQFTHLGNVSETTKFEKMAESCKKSLEILKLAQSRGLPPPRHHFEERSFNTVRIFPELSSTDMVVVIVKGMNLPAPSGIQPNYLDAYIKFDFPYPSAEQPQKNKTAVIKNTNSPEYNQSFTLSINRNHRGFRRLVTSKGLKLELLHKGGFLRSDKPIGTALVKLDKLESQSEIREIVEVMDGRKPTGGRVELKIRLREPLSGQDVQKSTERWLVIDQSQVGLSLEGSNDVSVE